MSTPSNVQIEIIIPTSVNVVLLVSENISANLRLQQASNLELPSLYQRALMVVQEAGEIGIARQREGG